MRGADLTDVDMEGAKARLVPPTPAVTPAEAEAVAASKEERARDDSRRLIARAMQWVAMWTWYLALVGLVIGCMLGSRPGVRDAGEYARWGSAIGAVSGLLLGAVTAIAVGPRFRRSPIRSRDDWDVVG
jgi:hypothetical protein